MKLFTAFFVIIFLSMLSPVFAEDFAQPFSEISQWADASDKFLDGLSAPVSIYGDDVRIKFGAESRYRIELKDDFNFNDRTFEDDAVNLFRNRLNADLNIGPYLRGFVEGQDSESFADSGLNRTVSFVNRYDIRQLYGEIKSPWEKLPLTAKAGRQELAYGDKRFVGASMWSNVASLFDAVKLVFPPTEWFQSDLWFSQPVRVRRNRADSGAHEDNFYGSYTAIKPFKDHVFDTFFFIRHNLNNEIAGEKRGERGQLKEYTTGNRFKGKKWDFDYGIEWAIQFGSRAHEDILAWAWHNETGYTFSKVFWTPRIHFGFNHASGDDNPADGDYGNFDNLFPSNHDKYGFMDFVSLRNTNNFELGLNFKPASRVSFSFDYHWFFLDTNRSAWFNASQSVVRSAKSGASTTVGQELDLLTKWNMTKHLALMVGYSHFHAGAFAKDTGAHNSAEFFYLQTSVNI